MWEPGWVMERVKVIFQHGQVLHLNSHFLFCNFQGIKMAYCFITRVESDHFSRMYLTALQGNLPNNGAEAYLSFVPIYFSLSLSL